MSGGWLVNVNVYCFAVLKDRLTSAGHTLNCVRFLFIDLTSYNLRNLILGGT